MTMVTMIGFYLGNSQVAIAIIIIIMETKQNKSAYFKYAELRSLEVEITELETKITTV